MSDERAHRTIGTFDYSVGKRLPEPTTRTAYSCDYRKCLLDRPARKHEEGDHA